MTRSTPTETATRRTLSLKRDSVPAVSVEERLHKVLAQAGLGSRRALEERIAQGQVRVNGEVAATGSSIKSGDRIELDGRSFVATAQTEAPRVLLYNKPEGEVTTREDPEGRPTVFDKLPALKGSRWISVGRLDINTTGLLLLTTDGDLANALMHPSAEITREYVCRIHGEVSDAQVQQLARGVELEDGPARFDEIERIGSSDSHAWFRVVLHEGRNREVRRLWEAIGYQVSRLKRVRYGTIALPRLLKRGQHEELPAEATEQLRAGLKLQGDDATLTLQPVIGQRRAKVSEYRPAPREQRAWTHASQGDEARELRAFDNLREERPGKPRYGKPGGRPGAPGGARGANPRGPKKPGAAARGNRPIPDDIGNRLSAPGGQRKRKGSAPGFENPAEHRSWYVPEGVTTTSRIAPPRHVGRPGPLSDRGANNSPYGKIKSGGRDGAARGPGSNARGAGPGGNARGAGPGGGTRSAGPGGNARGASPRGATPQGGKGRGPGQGPRGNTRGPGHGAPRSNKPRG